jgi:hypothetical protein
MGRLLSPVSSTSGALGAGFLLHSSFIHPKSGS